MDSHSPIHPSRFLFPLALTLGCLSLLTGCKLDQKRADAIEEPNTANYATNLEGEITGSCAPYSLFKSFSTSYFSACLGCHGGTAGAGGFTINSGTDDTAIAQNYITVLGRLVRAYDSSEGDPTKEKLISYPTGQAGGHVAFLSPSSGTVTDAYNWIYSEWENDAATPCTYARPGQGAVSP